MQLLYAKGSDEALDYKGSMQRYSRMIDHSYDVFLYNLYCLVQISKVAIQDEEKKRAKHLPSEADKAFSAKLSENELIRSLRDNPSLTKVFDQKGFNAMTDRDHMVKIYNEFAKEEAYITYLGKECAREDHVEILLELYRFCRKNELFNEIIGDAYLNWIDDKSLVIGAVKKVIKSLPVEGTAFLKDYYPDDETIKEYGEPLLNRTFKGDEALLSIIKPILTNWDHERLALIDMILLKMAACEMLEFPTIPAKVTLNEYVEVAKTYSTDKSKEFVNGVLDKLMKQLEEDGKLNKEGRGLID
ncbi:MAG: transcription antitermination factor NusB [Saprospiraceae bacterium]|nr:transcription antitermination factor NusB [Saprospiraceae bacterium]